VIDGFIARLDADGDGEITEEEFVTEGLKVRIRAIHVRVCSICLW